MPRFHFITGLPRSGGAVLSAILNQNPRFHSDMASPVAALFDGILGQLGTGSEWGEYVDLAKRRDLLLAVMETCYAGCGREVVFDASRLWSAKLPLLRELFPGAKTIALVRNVAWALDSMERLYRANPFENTRLFASGIESGTVYNRADALARRDHLVGYCWSTLKEAFYSEQADSLLVVDYDLLAQRPREVVELVYQFLGEEPFEHDFNNLTTSPREFDRVLGVRGLGKVRPAVSFIPRRSILPPDVFERYAGFSFWRDAAPSLARVVLVQNDRPASEAPDLDLAADAEGVPGLLSSNTRN
jgi:sulfotransferase